MQEVFNEYLSEVYSLKAKIELMDMKMWWKQSFTLNPNIWFLTGRGTRTKPFQTETIKYVLAGISQILWWNKNLFQLPLIRRIHSLRFFTPHFSQICCMWVATVLTAMNSVSAISLLLWFSYRSSEISTSRFERLKVL